MICFLTSSPITEDRKCLDPANGFVDRLRASLPEPCAALFVCSDPDGFARTDGFAAATRFFCEAAGFRFRAFAVLDRRNQDRAADLVGRAEFLILAGGHTPTQNRFFAEIGLRELLKDFDGVLLGISAGSMNCAELVYAQPEREGEAVDPDYQRFLPGLGLTKQMILPHYQMIKDDVLDGLRVMEEIAFPDSMGREFLIFPDGTYLLIENGRQTVCGKAWRLKDGVMTPLCANNETVEV
jgi:dipeptidase E